MPSVEPVAVVRFGGGGLFFLAKRNPKAKGATRE
jgi:hypothetical protein